MKKIVGLFLILVLLFLTSCDFIGNTDGYIEIWSSCDEFDAISFDFDKYITDLQNEKGVQIELWEEKDNVQEYLVTYSDKSILNFRVCNDGEMAKKNHQEITSAFINVRSINPFLTSIRINNIVIYPNDDLISNKRLIQFAMSIGIESDQIVLTKINESSRVIQKNTKKTFESILESLEERGFSIEALLESPEEGDFSTIGKTSFTGNNYQIYTLVSNDNSAVYELFVISGDQAGIILFNRIKLSILDVPHDHVHVYYSIGNDFCMYIMGTSANTYDLWNEIR